MLERNSLHFQKDFDNLSKYQVNFLRMLTDGVTENFYANENITKYNLGSSSNIVTVLKSLEQKEFIDRFEGTVEFIDPAFKIWAGRIMRR